MSAADTSVTACLAGLLDALGIERAHFLGCMSGDWGALALERPDLFGSLSVVAPHLNKGTPAGLEAFQVPAQVIAGDIGTPGDRARGLAEKFGNGAFVALDGYESPAWADTIADRTDEAERAVRDLVARAEASGLTATVCDAAGVGAVGDILYRIHGAGPAVVVLPLSMARTQWDPLVERLARDHAVIVLGGPRLGIVSLLEGRADAGYGDLVLDMLDRARIGPGDDVLEVGCGSGALSRALARRTGGEARITGADLNPYLLSEARALVARDGLSDTVSFDEGDAEALPYEDDRFDVAFCATVVEECDAVRMIAEMARVTRPGGRVVILSRVLDMDWWVGLPLDRDLRRKLETFAPSTGSGVGPGGCADARLYELIAAAGLAPVFSGPQFAIYGESDRLDDVFDRLFAGVTAEERKICEAAVGRARAAGTLMVGEPFHCAVATVRG